MFELAPHVTEAHLRECPGCGLFQVVPAIEAGMRADCPRCGTVLRRAGRDTIGRAMGLTIGALVLFLILWTTLLMKVSASGIVHEADLLAGPAELFRRGLWPVGAVVAFTTAFAPLCKFGGMAYVLVGLRARRPFPNIRGVFLFARTMGVWAMLDILLLGVFVAYTKLGDLVHIELGPAVYALALLTIVAVWADSVLDPDDVWDEITRRELTHDPMPAPGSAGTVPASAISCEACGLVSEASGHHAQDCPRCGSPLHARKPASLSRAWAYLIAGAIFYIPANYYPVLTVIQLGAGEPSTIIGGVEELFASKMYPLALLVFTASILVPVMKLVAMVVLLRTARPNRSSSPLRQRTTIYHVVAWIGRWSMVDIFMESLLGALVQFSGLVTIDPGLGALAFCAVVILTMLSAESFDPRLMWDAAGENPKHPPEITQPTIRGAATRGIA